MFLIAWELRLQQCSKIKKQQQVVCCWFRLPCQKPEKNLLQQSRMSDITDILNLNAGNCLHRCYMVLSYNLVNSISNKINNNFFKLFKNSNSPIPMRIEDCFIFLSSLDFTHKKKQQYLTEPFWSKVSSTDLQILGTISKFFLCYSFL